MRGFSMNIFFQKMLRCIPADVINETRSRATFRMLTNKDSHAKKHYEQLGDLWGNLPMNPAAPPRTRSSGTSRGAVSR